MLVDLVLVCPIFLISALHCFIAVLNPEGTDVGQETLVANLCASFMYSEANVIQNRSAVIYQRNPGSWDRLFHFIRCLSISVQMTSPMAQCFSNSMLFYFHVYLADGPS